MYFVSGLTRGYINQAYGNPFAQLLHGGDTLKSRNKHQVIALQTIDPEWSGTWIVCMDYQRSVEYKASVVAKLARSAIANICGITSAPQSILKTSIQDGSALEVAESLSLDKNTCVLHNLDKVSRYGTGLLVRSFNRKTYGGFPDCVALINTARKIAKFLSCNEARKSALHGACKRAGIIPLLPAVDLSTASIAAVHNMIYSIVKLEPALLIFCDFCNRKRPGLISTDDQLIFSKVNSNFFNKLREIEGVLHIVKFGTAAVPAGSYIMGGFGPIVAQRVLDGLRATKFKVLDSCSKNTARTYVYADEMAADDAFIKTGRDITFVSTIGKRLIARCTAEMEKRFCVFPAYIDKLKHVSCAPNLADTSGTFLDSSGDKVKRVRLFRL